MSKERLPYKLEKENRYQFVQVRRASQPKLVTVIVKTRKEKD
jgi:hypothetical protein